MPKSRNWPTYRDAKGNILRSKLELRVARALQRETIPCVVEKRPVTEGLVFYPDFTLNAGQKIAEVVGYAADWYWDKTAEKLKLIAKNYPAIQLGVVTRFQRAMRRRLKGVPGLALFTPYQPGQLTDWCRGMPGFTSL